MRTVLLICACAGLTLSGGLWLASYFDMSYVTREYAVLANDGSLGVIQKKFEKKDNKGNMSSRVFMEVKFERNGQQLDGFHVAGFDGFHTEWWPLRVRTAMLKSVEVPLWMPTALFVVLTALCLPAVLRRRQWARGGMCTSCGYDLTGLRDSRCPECGLQTVAAGK